MDETQMQVTSGGPERPQGDGAAGQAAPIVIGHRGASGYLPEHTLASYAAAVLAGADYAEPDLVMTRDGVLIARHENEIGGTTDVAAHPEFADRHTTRRVDGIEVSGWFTEDFTLAEIKRLRARERIGELRPANCRFDGQFEVPTLEEILELLRGLDAQRAARAQALGLPAPTRVGIYPETKHPSYFAERGLGMERELVRMLEAYGFAGRTGRACLQSFEVGNLKALARMTELPLVQLIDDTGAPWDLTVAGDACDYAQLVTPAGLDGVAAYARGIGPAKALVMATDAQGALQAPTPLVHEAHQRGLAVHPWTFRAENHFLPPPLRSGTQATHTGNLAAEIRAYLRAGIDGFFTDQPDIGRRACEQHLAGAA